MKTCEKCFRPISNDAIFCNHCNNPVYYNPIEIVRNRLRNVVLLIIAIAAILYLSSCKKDYYCTYENRPLPTTENLIGNHTYKNIDIIIINYEYLINGNVIKDTWICATNNQSNWERVTYVEK